jgi:cyclopropane fatty-acyl-phospholipid synthase-like methyltransferase
MSERTEWWEGFFGGLWLEVQRRFKSAEQTRAEADFIERALRLPPRAEVLDVPCGEGRLALELAARGHRPTGVDATPALLADARAQAEGRGLRIEWAHRDMRDLPWVGRFDAAFCAWGSFGYFDDAGNAAFLGAVARALRPGGRFLMDGNCVETMLPRFQERGWQQVGDVLWLEERRFDHVTCRVENDWTFVRGATIERRRASIRVYTYRELCQLLHAAGFASCEGYGSMSREPFALGSRRLYLVATKQSA